MTLTRALGIPGGMKPTWLTIGLLLPLLASQPGWAAQVPTSPASEAPPQLNVPGFAYCLAQEEPRVDLDAEAKAYGFSSSDLLVIYLSLYPGKRLPGPLARLQDKAHSRWARAFETREAALAEWLRTQTDSLSPSRFFREALQACDGSAFCAALISHNVLRTLGRHEQALYHDALTGAAHDLNPEWFTSSQELWSIQIPLLQKQLLSLRPDRDGDGWGEWYHFFGILSYSIHELSINQGMAHVDLVVRLNELLNPILAGGPEGAEKARLDRDSAHVAWDFLRGADLEDRRNSRSCDERASYVSDASSSAIE